MESIRDSIHSNPAFAGSYPQDTCHHDPMYSSDPTDDCDATRTSSDNNFSGTSFMCSLILGVIEYAEEMFAKDFGLGKKEKVPQMGFKKVLTGEINVVDWTWELSENLIGFEGFEDCLKDADFRNCPGYVY